MEQDTDQPEVQSLALSGDLEDAEPGEEPEEIERKLELDPNEGSRTNSEEMEARDDVRPFLLRRKSLQKKWSGQRG